MGIKIVWSPRARIDYTEILKYIKGHYGLSACKQFHKKTETALQVVSQFPQIYPVADNDPEIRRCVLSKHTTTTDWKQTVLSLSPSGTMHVTQKIWS